MANTAQNQNVNPGISSTFSVNVIMALIAIVVGMIAFFWDGLISLGEAWSRPEYSYGPIVPVITGYMTLRELHHTPIRPNRDSKLPGLFMVGFGLLLGLLGNLSQIPDIITYGFIIVIGGFFLISTGFREGFRFWPGWLHLFFMLPLPNFLYWKVSNDLQFISSNIGVEVIYAMNIPVFLDGNIIDLGKFKLQVAEACSGLRYMFPLLSFGWLFAVLYNGPTWHRVVLFFSTIPITILMNSFRIGVIGVLVHKFGIAQAEGFMHYFQGWIIFISCIAILFLEAWILQRFFARRLGYDSILDIDFEGIFGPLSKIKSMSVPRAMTAACAALLVCGALWQLIPDRASAAIDREKFVMYPMKIDEWNGHSIVLEPDIERVLGADDYLLASYVSTKGKPPVNLFLSFYNSQTAGSGIHSPEVCIPAGGWEISRLQQESISIEGERQMEFAVNRAIIEKGIERQLVYYWFEGRGRQLTSDYWAKYHTMLDSITSGRSDGGLVRVITPIIRGEGEAGADKRLQGFLQKAMPLMPGFIPN